MIATPNGKYRKHKGHCECVVGQDPNSKQPHLIVCKKPAVYIWFWRQWLYEVIQGSSKPIYSNIGAACCQECFDKVKENGPPADLEHYRKLWEKNKCGC